MSVEDGTCHNAQEAAVSTEDGVFMMTKKLLCLPKMGLCHFGHEDAVSAKDGTLS